MKYSGIELIPEGEINFSQMCRDNEELGTAKKYLNIILSGLFAIQLTKHLYNLLLATLGIDNPYVYEKEEGMDVTKDLNTGITTYRTKDKSGNKVIFRRKGGKDL